LIFFLLILSFGAFAQKQIEILGADELEYDESFGKIQRCKGNVRFRQDNALMRCDSAWFYEDENRVEAFGNIHINQQDTMNLWGDYLEYDGDDRKALVNGNVRLTDNEMTLRTPSVEYLMDERIGYYTQGGEITNNENYLKSKRGSYFANSKTFFFKDEVFLRNPEYTMECDTLQYNTLSRIAYFRGPTYIRSEENLIFCHYGWYNTSANTSQFSKGTYLRSESNLLIADSLLYNRNTGLGRAFGSIELHDTLENISVYGQRGEYYQKEKRSVIYGNAYALQIEQSDTLLLKSDTLYDFTDSLNIRSLSAFPSTSIYRSDMQGICDSLVYRFADSSIHLYDNPLLWNDNNQIVGDTISVFRKNGQLDQLFVRKNAFLLSEEDSLHYNQIKGRMLYGYFKGNKLNEVEIIGNGESVYYAREDDGSYSGVNYIQCAEMLIDIRDNKVQGIHFYNKPEGTFYPPTQLPGDKEKLDGFNWKPELRPLRSTFAEMLQKKLPDFKTYFSQ
jgi:lipopolysaccharide export system protein LptA